MKNRLCSTSEIVEEGSLVSDCRWGRRERVLVDHTDLPDGRALVIRSSERHVAELTCKKLMTMLIVA